MFQLVRYSRWKSPLKNLKKSQSDLLFPFYISTTTTVDRDESNPSRPSPPPIRVSITESAGRGVFATRAIGAGELIHTAKPIVSHPSLSTPTSVCYLCLRSLRNRTTSEAQGVSFCSHDCEEQSKVFHEVEKQADWSAYKEYCCTQGLKYPLLAKRLACMVMSGEANADSLDILQPAILSPEMISLMEKEFTLLRSAFEEAYIKDEQMAFLTKQWYVGVLARIRINAFRIELAGGLYDYEDLLSSAAALVEAEAAVGNAVYMLPSFYNHDCDPNAHIVWIENSDARVKALRDIEAGEELRICYIDASMDHDGRQTLLSEGDILFWAALSFLVLFAYPTPEVPTPSFEYHAAFSVVTLGIVSGIQQTYHQFHHENVARLFTPQLKLATFAGRMLVGIPTILLVKFCIKALAKWSLPIVANTLGIPIKSTSYIPVLSQEIPITTSNSGETLVEVKQPGYHQKLFFFSWLSSVDVDTGIRFLQYAALAWSVVALVPSLFSLLRL